MLADFDILEEVGRGSSGTVFYVKCRPESLDKLTDPFPVQDKFKYKHYLSQKTKLVLKKIYLNPKRQRQREQAIREAETMKRLHHPFIITCYGSFVEMNDLYIVMEYANGGNLESYIRRRKAILDPLKQEEIVRFCWEIS